MDKNKYRKHFIALESNPEVFTKLSHKLGVSEAFCFVDVLSLDLVEMLPRPALALILTFPTSAEYERHKSTEDAEREEYTEIDEDGVIWLPQTINNACGLYALLHAVFNSEARHLIRKSVQILGSQISLIIMFLSMVRSKISTGPSS
jgi:ubiquitin carboxyl-terminal hydrolase L3